MEFTPPNLDIVKLKRQMDITGLTLEIDAVNYFGVGRFYMLWRDGIFLVIQAEPWWRPGCFPENGLPTGNYLEEYRALLHLREVIQTMLDSIIFNGENNWAYLVRLKNGSYHLVYRKRHLPNIYPIWTKVVELDDIKITRFQSGLCWEGIYEGKEVDLFMGWRDEWANYVSAESRGQKLVQSMGVGHYFFDLEAHVSQKGIVVGLMMEAIVGRSVTPADRAAVYEAVTDIQRHGIFFSFQSYDIYITERGVRFSTASSAKYFHDRDELAVEAKFMWKTLEDIFNHMDDIVSNALLSGSRSSPDSSVFIIPSPPSPDRTITLTPEEAIIRWVWSIVMSDECYHSPCNAFKKLHALYRPATENSATRHRDRRVKGDKRALLPPDDFPSNFGAAAIIDPVDAPLVVDRGPTRRWHPYVQWKPKRLLLPRESDSTPPML